MGALVVNSLTAIVDEVMLTLLKAGYVLVGSVTFIFYMCDKGDVNHHQNVLAWRKVELRQ